MAGSGDDKVFVNFGGSQIDLGSGDDVYIESIPNSSGSRPSFVIPNSTTVVVGGTGRDKIFTGSGDDVVSGDSGSDSISGGAGNDQLLGHADDDVVLGGAGKDRIDGGTGADIFVIHSRSGVTDIIEDFNFEGVGRIVCRNLENAGFVFTEKDFLINFNSSKNVGNIESVRRYI